MNCPKCGKPMIPGAYFCGYCGEKFVLPQQGEHQFPIQAHRPKRKILFSLGIIALCIIVCADVLLIRKVRTNYADEGRTIASQGITESSDAASADISAFGKIGSAVKNILSVFEKDKSFAEKELFPGGDKKDPAPENAGAAPEKADPIPVREKTPSSPYGGTIRALNVEKQSFWEKTGNGYRKAPVFENDSVYRFQILSISFYDTTENVPQDAWNIASDGTVLAWLTEADLSSVTDETLLTALRQNTKTGKVYDLHIASNGIIFAPENSFGLFKDFSSVKAIHFNNAFNTSGAMDMDYMFHDCRALTELDLGGFDTSNVTNMGMMFEECSSLTKLDLSGFDTSNVTYMARMFCSCSALTTLDFRGWDTSSVKKMSYMFLDCHALKEMNLSAWDTSNVTSMLNMFGSCSALNGLDLSAWDISSVTDMGWLFYGCNVLTNLDLSGWDTSAVGQTVFALDGCPVETQERWGYLFN